MQINTEVSIPGRVDEVWAVLTDLPAYPRWNPFIRKVEGAFADGAAWNMELTIDGWSFFTFPTVITHLVHGRQLEWRGGLPRLMTGLHGFGVTEAAGVVTLMQSESFSGVLVPAVLPLLRRPLTRRFVEMNEALMSEVVRRRASTEA